MKEFITRPIAHRGSFDNVGIAENSIKAFKKSIAHQYCIECDVVMSKDQEVIVFHDNDLSRMTNLDVKVSDLSSQELRKINLLNTQSTIPTLDETLHSINARTPLMIEIKKGSHPEIEERIIEIIRSYDGPICLKTFEIDSIRWIKENAPYIKYGLVGSNLNIDIENLIELGIDFLSYDINCINDPIVKLAKNKGIPVIAWTINTEEKYKMGLKLADNIIFENISIK